MAFITNPTIFTNGLSVYFDAVNPRSYAGSGNTAYDLSGTGGTLYLNNSPVYSSVGSADGVDLHDIDGNYLETFDSVADARHKLGLLPFAN